MADNKKDLLNLMRMKSEIANKEEEKITHKPVGSQYTPYFQKRDKEDTINQILSRSLNKRLALISLKKDIPIKTLLSNIVEIWLDEYDTDND